MHKIEIGAFVRDKDIRVICGFVVGHGTLKMGRKALSAYRVRLANGTEMLIADTDIEERGRVLDCTPQE